MNTHKHWIVTTDSRRSTLYSCRWTPGGELNLEAVSTLANDHEGEHEHHRPAMLGGAERRGARTGGSAHAAPHSASFGHESDEEHLRFAREVAAWVADRIPRAREESMTVFAPARLLGLLRSQIGSGATNGRVRLCEGELANLGPDQLATHPAVSAAVGRDGGSR